TLLLFHVNFANGINTSLSIYLSILIDVVRKGMTLTSHTLIYHCLIYLHQTILQNRFLKVSAIAYMSKSVLNSLLSITNIIIFRATNRREGCTTAESIGFAGFMCTRFKKLICVKNEPGFRQTRLRLHGVLGSTDDNKYT